jgi:hypothetical protein
MFWKLFGDKRKGASSLTWLDHIRLVSRAWGLRVSSWLQRKTMILPPARLKIYCVGLFMVFAGWNGWIVFQALQQPPPSLIARQLKLSRPTRPNILPPADPSALVGIQRFRSWLDSLQADTVGRRIYDSILRQRPGLLDSLRQFEKSYSIHH